MEQAETVLGGQFKDPVTTEAIQVNATTPGLDVLDDDPDLVSRYANQPKDVKEGVQSAYQSLRKNLNSAAQTILAVPMEVYERSGSEVCIPLTSYLPTCSRAISGYRPCCCPSRAYRCPPADDWGQRSDR